MPPRFGKSFLATPTLVAASLLSISITTPAQTTWEEVIQQLDRYSAEEQEVFSQVTHVNRLRDVSPTDWAYEALRSLSDRYGCILAFPDLAILLQILPWPSEHKYEQNGEMPYW